MDEIQVMQLLFEDISRLELPPISEKVLVAIREKKQEIAKNSLIHPATEKEHKNTPTKYLFAAMLTLLTVSLPIIVVLSNKTPVSNSQNSLGLSNNKEIVSIAESQIVPSTTENETALEYIKFKHIYGEVVLSDRNEKELETLLVTYSTKDSVYEDDRYIYNFDSQGRLIEMCNLIPMNEDVFSVTEQNIHENVEILMNEYYYDWGKNYTLDINRKPDSDPAWYVYVTKADGKLAKRKITMSFHRTGKLLRIWVDSSATNFGIISKAEAVEIVLKELRNEKYKLQKFKNKDIEITVNTKEMNDKLYYAVKIDKIPYKIAIGEVYRVWYLFLVDSDTGEFSLVDYST